MKTNKPYFKCKTRNVFTKITITTVFLSYLIVAKSNICGYMDTLNMNKLINNEIQSDTLILNNIVFYNNKNGDTAIIKIGNKELILITNDGKVEIRMKDSSYLSKSNNGVKIEEKEDKENSDSIADVNVDNKEKVKEIIKKIRFEKGRWSGIEIGLNNLMNSDFSSSRDSSSSFMNLNTNKSWNVNINFAKVSFPIMKRVSLISGLGLEYNNYFFCNKNSIKKDNNHIVSLDLSEYNLIKSKLTTLFIRMPLIFEYNFIKDSKKSPFIQAGIIGGLKISSHTKFVHTDNGSKKKVKDYDDFNINWLRYGFIGKVGYGDFGVYVTYYPVRFFEKNQGPELYPINVGISFFSF